MAMLLAALLLTTRPLSKDKLGVLITSRVFWSATLAAPSVSSSTRLGVWPPGGAVCLLPAKLDPLVKMSSRVLLPC